MALILGQIRKIPDIHLFPNGPEKQNPYHIEQTCYYKNPKYSFVVKEQDAAE